jgi:two-component system chemotaxis response regulator CheB
MKKIRVLVVDDSALMRKMIPAILASDPEIEVVGTAIDGLFALQKIKALEPDVITLDMNMPRMDGMETLEHITADYGTPTIIVSSLTEKDAELTLQALNAGAIDFVTKPQDAISLHINEIGSELAEKIKAAHRNPLARLRIKKIRPGFSAAGGGIRIQSAIKRQTDIVLAIGASTGGPNALSYLLPLLPGNFPAAIVIVQHMPVGFTGMFASRLDSLCTIEVKEASDGDLLLPGRALVAPGDRHLKVRRLPLGSIAVLSDSPAINGHKPSVDILFRSVASEFGCNAAALMMTGMGADGAEGTGEIIAKGGATIAQDEESCVVFGMPKSAVERGYVQDVVNLDHMADFLIELFSGKEKNNGTVSS